MIAIMLAGATAMLVSLFGTRWLIVFFRSRGQGQPILGKEDHGPEHHMHKQGTPTMGGIAIVVAALVGWLVAHVRPGLAFSDQSMIVWVGVLFMALMGFLDDFIKVRKRHNRGIFWKQKNYITMLAQLRHGLVARRQHRHLGDDLGHPRGRPGLEVPTFVWVIFAGLVIWATTNAVNVTDGLDGLAAGSALMGFAAFTIIAYWALPQPRHLQHGRQPARPGRVRRRVRRRLPRASCGGTPRRRGSSWATSAHWPSARRWRSSP